MQLLLSYMYRGEVDVEDNELADFLKTASGLQIKGLSEQENQGKPEKVQSVEKPKKSFVNNVATTVPKRRQERPDTPPPSNLPSNSYQPTEEISRYKEYLSGDFFPRNLLLNSDYQIVCFITFITTAHNLSYSHSCTISLSQTLQFLKIFFKSS